MADQPAVRRNAPAGEFLVEHFMGHGDTRTHTERLNPLHGNSFGWVPGAQVGFQPPPLQTYNGIDTPILAQLAAPEPVADVVDETPLASEAKRVADVVGLAADISDEKEGRCD